MYPPEPDAEFAFDLTPSLTDGRHTARHPRTAPPSPAPLSAPSCTDAPQVRSEEDG